MQTGLPTKRREIVNAHVDSTIWNRFEYRPGDVVVANWGKSGCTWLQQIVCQLLFGGRSDIPVKEISPWLEFALASPRETIAKLEQQKHRRVIKTHLAVDALVFSPVASYVYVGRDGRDVAWSLFNHFRKLNPDWYTRMRTLRGEFGPLLAEPPQDFRAFFHEWLDRDGFPMWPFWEHVRSWWEVSTLPNVMLVHHAELKRDLRGCAERLASFLDTPVDDQLLSDLVRHSSFEYMKARADTLVPGVPGRSAYQGGAQSFFNAGENGRWREILTKEDIDKYEAIEARELSPDCIRWLRGEPT